MLVSESLSHKEILVSDMKLATYILDEILDEKQNYTGLCHTFC